MGKDFRKEIQNLDLVYQSAYSSDINLMAEFIRRFSDVPCLCIGSGGSYSVSTVFEYLFTKNGGFAKRITPLELSNYQTQLRKICAVIFTAGGRNRDSLNVYKYLSESEPSGLLTCCMNKDAPIKELQRENLHNYYFEYSMPVRKDGYLAVESIVSCLVLLCHAFERATQNEFYQLPSTFSWSSENSLEEQMVSVLKKETLLVLHGGITTPAAVDLESKFGESSLGNIQLVDFRNFSHGRHFWLTDRGEKTAVVSLSGKSDSVSVEKTLDLLPCEIPVLRLTVDDESAIGLLQSFSFVFNLVLQAGIMHGINPGKPMVADFGKKIYHLNCNFWDNSSILKRRKDPIEMAIYRKMNNLIGLERDVYSSFANFEKMGLHTKKFRGIVFDFDGTIFNEKSDKVLFNQICEKIGNLLSKEIVIGIATGRGKSVRNELQKHIPEDYWSKVVIAYYNGGCIGLLGDNNQPNKAVASENASLNQAFTKIIEYKRKYSLRINGVEKSNPYQITLLFDDNANTLISSVESCLRDVHDIRILKSDHSLDIVPVSSNKNNIFSYFLKIGYKKEDFILIGDSGQVGGNDYELLNQTNALSVDQVSDNAEFCWNFAKPGIRNLEATLFYLDKLVIQDGCFSFKRW